MKIPIIYWTGTGKTKIMAEAIKEGIEFSGSEAIMKRIDEAGIADIKDVSAFVLGTPAMAIEEPAEEMEVFLNRIEKEKITGKTVGVFGSYDWGEGQWLRDLVSRLKKDGFKVVGEGLAIRLEPDSEGLEKCRSYGRMIVESSG